VLCDKSHERTQKRSQTESVSGGGDRISERTLDTVEFIK
jgi:hypothetical protein